MIDAAKSSLRRAVVVSAVFLAAAFLAARLVAIEHEGYTAALSDDITMSQEMTAVAEDLNAQVDNCTAGQELDSRPIVAAFTTTYGGMILAGDDIVSHDDTSRISGSYSELDGVITVSSTGSEDCIVAVPSAFAAATTNYVPPSQRYTDDKWSAACWLIGLVISCDDVLGSK